LRIGPGPGVRTGRAPLEAAERNHHGTTHRGPLWPDHHLTGQQGPSGNSTGSPHPLLAPLLLHVGRLQADELTPAGHRPRDDGLEPEQPSADTIARASQAGGTGVRPLAGWSIRRAKCSTACSTAAAVGKTSICHPTGLAGRRAVPLSTSSGTREKRCTAFVTATNPDSPSVRARRESTAHNGRSRHERNLDARLGDGQQRARAARLGRPCGR
jgi:hypothetical protein